MFVILALVALNLVAAPASQAYFKLSSVICIQTSVTEWASLHRLTYHRRT